MKLKVAFFNFESQPSITIASDAITKVLHMISIPNYKDGLPQKMLVIAWIDKIDKSILL